MSKDRGRSVRQLRVGEELRHALADALGRGDLRDPALNGRSITVSEVRVSPDLRNATVFVLPLGGGDDSDVMQALGRAAPHLRSVVGKARRLKYLPVLRFARDESFDTATRVDALLRDPSVQRDLAAGDAEEDAKEDAAGDAAGDKDEPA